ncbi:hypothetical protein [Algibacter sp. PT7-4]|uniref:hypothetical protein n=1 Tax=Algibacter ulvanivorans TaxID=3400999 RepID=UPI003AAEA1A4
MISVKDANLNSKILKELNYSFADVFIFDGFVISEIKRGVNFNWNDHASKIVEDVACFLGKDGKDVIYISNRINSYAVVAVDWFKFFKNNYFLKNYFVVSNKSGSKLNLMIESLFFKDKIKSFNSLYTAVNWVKKGDLKLPNSKISLF